MVGPTDTAAELVDDGAAEGRAAPLGAVLAMVLLASLGTGVFWNAISFVAKHAYDFSQQRTFVLYIVMGALYTIGAAGAGRLTRSCERWIRPRAVLAVLIAIQVILCLVPVSLSSEWALWAAVIGITLTSSFFWPIVESYLVAGRHGRAMRRAVGWFNVVWMSAVAVPLLLMAPILEQHSEWAVGAQAIANLAAFVPLAFLPSRPGHHDRAASAANVPAEYALLLLSARVLLPMSYLLTSGLSPILPYRLEAIGAAVEVRTPVTATWMIVRVFAAAVLWRAEFWHGRWGALVGAGLAIGGGFGAAVLAGSLPVMLAGLAVFGTGMAMVYHAALYYAMAVGRGQVEASGTHEALIGAGYTAGPIAGLVGSLLGGGPAIVGIALAALGVAAVPAFLPYRAARRQRRAAGHGPLG